MANFDNTRREHPSTYFVQDRSNEEELVRLQIQDEAVTAGMGGVLPEQFDPTRFQHVLDVACGTGNWLLTYAKTYPSIPQLVGIDVSSKMIDYANRQAAEQQVSERVTFGTMDALRMLEFPSASFDLINQRFGSSYLRKWDWPNILREFHRVGKPGAIIRLTDPNMIIESNSPALKQLFDVQLDSAYRSGHVFTPTSQGLNGELASLLQRHGYQNVQTHDHILEYQGSTMAGQNFYENMKRMFRTVLPFMRKWTHVPDNYEALYQQALHDIEQPDFVAHWRLLTVWGNIPEARE